MTDTTTNAFPIRVSAQVGPQLSPFAQQRATWIAADELGADAIFTWDHFFPSIPGADPAGTNFEAYMLMSAMAEVTERAQIGALVTGNGYRNPNLQADMARTIDHISGGRFIFGIGSGWMERDYLEYGFELGTPGSRLKDLALNLPIIKERFTKLNPGPVNGTIPILIGGSGEKVTLRLVAEHADMWHTSGEVEKIAQKSAVLDEWCAQLGRDPRTVERSISMTPELVDRIEDYITLGATHFVVNHTGPEHDLGFLRELIQWRDAR